MLLRLVAGLLAALLLNTTFAHNRPRIDKAADLPRFTYPVKGSLEALVKDPTAFAAFAADVRRDTESVLTSYDIADKASERQLLGTLLLLDILESRDADALKRIEQIRVLQEKPADKLLTGLVARAIIDGRKAAGGTSGPSYLAVVRSSLEASLKPLPYAVVANEIKETKASAELLGEGRVLGYINEVLQPAADKTGALSNDLAPGLINARYSLVMRLAIKQTLVDTYAAYLAANKVDKPDIWAARNVSLEHGRPYTPVIVAVWDSGVDTAVFKSQVMRDAAGVPLVIGFDKYANPQNTELEVLTPEMQARVPLMKSRTKGFSDLQSNVDSPEANEVKQLLSTLPREQYKSTVEELILAGNYTHGTHVAGIAIEGNPYARLLVARIGFGNTLLPDPCPSREQSIKDAKSLVETVEFLKRNRARVVNMSWGGSVNSIENELELCGIGKTQDERKKLAREYFEIGRSALEKAFASAPQILFITAAGNSNEDATFAEFAPAGIVLPNLLTVGAVDKAGDEASFTSYGPTVKVHANGYQVESYLPGGDRVAFSGTSMASPQVANLAGKIFAVNPALTPPQVIEIIVSTADKTADARRTLVNPKRALETAGQRKT
jgi:subtilisin family serine protease